MALSQDLTEFLIEFSIALHRTSMYPWGHPSLERAASSVLARLTTLLADRPNISMGVARRQLVIEGVATDPRHPVLRSLAAKLHRHHIGAVSLTRGITASELASMMRLVGAEPEKGEQPLGLGDPDRLRQWANVRLFPLTYEQLQMIDAEDDAEADEDRDRGTRSAQLWIGLARAALAKEDADVEPESTEPAVVAQAINEHPQALAYDQVIVGYLLQLAQELKSDNGAGSSAIRRRVSGLISALDGRTLTRLLEMGGDLDQRRRFVLDAAEALPADAVVELVQAAASSTNQTVSSSMLRLLTKLSAFAEQGTQVLQAQADVALREQVQQLINRWGLADPNPDEYTQALDRMAHSSTAATIVQTRFPPEPLRIVQIAIEVDALGVPLWRAVAEIIRAEGYRPLIDVLTSAPPENRTARALWDHIGQVDTVRGLLAHEPVDFIDLGQILDRLDPKDTVPVLVEVLAESDARSTRMGIYKRLVHAPAAALVEAITPYLQDTRWYVQRNMLALLNEADLLPPHVTPSAYARHPDPRVRREALQLWLKAPNERERAVCVALADSDERALRIGVAAARTNCPEAAVPLIVNRLTNPNLSVDLRVQLTRLLQSSRAPIALEALLRIATAGRTLFGKPKLAHRSPEMLAAIQVIAAAWSTDSRGSAVIDRARKSSDPEIRAAAQSTTL